ncbi:MAG: hypothetical protein MJZ17_03595 [Bacteroidales bacterium]|nr:hypothetical protein [Bacteroidales bacterium]
MKNSLENSAELKEKYPFSLGRKNYMFCGNDDAACRAAIAYSLISSCKAVGIDPRTWPVLLNTTKQ